jgi:hypothetical protein
MKLVYLESPYAGKTKIEVKRNLCYARQCMRDCLDRQEAPFASHLLYTQPGILDDKDLGERARGIAAGLVWSSCAALTVVYVDHGITDGMREGIARAVADGRPIEYRSLAESRSR